MPRAWWDIPPLNSCPESDKPGAKAFKNSPFYQNQREKNFPSPQNLNIYIYITFFLKKQKFEGIKR